MNNNVEDIELELMLEAIFKRYGHDFRNYSRASIKRRVKYFLNNSDHKRISELTAKLLYDQEFLQQLIQHFSIPVTEMFRDPDFYSSLRTNILPLLKTYPFVKIWHAGCASGEEVYSLAIVLREEGLYDRSTIYATDFNESMLEKAKQGIYSITDIKNFMENYRKSGGAYSLANYFEAHYDSVIMSGALKKNITFARHNLAVDNAFGEMHLIMCRNVLIYFDRILQDRVFRLFDDSLIRDGFLCLGKKETLSFSAIAPFYESISNNMKIYQKRRPYQEFDQ